MIKSELIQRISQGNQHLFHKDIERIVNIILEEIIDALARGDRVELRGFGAFTVKHRAPRVGRNPRTGAAVKVEEKHVPFFKTGRELRDRLNASFTPQASRRGGKSAKADKPAKAGKTTKTAKTARGRPEPAGTR